MSDRVCSDGVARQNTCPFGPPRLERPGQAEPVRFSHVFSAIVALAFLVRLLVSLWTSRTYFVNLARDQIVMHPCTLSPQVQYQRYFASLLQKLAPSAVASEDDPSEKPKSRPPSPSDGSLDSILSSMDASLKRILPQLSLKPRLLVCAPSNAATDELLARVLDRGFIDGELRSYKPNVARVGLDHGSPAAQAVSVERRANQVGPGLRCQRAAEMHGWFLLCSTRSRIG